MRGVELADEGAVDELEASNPNSRVPSITG